MQRPLQLDKSLTPCVKAVIDKTFIDYLPTNEWFSYDHMTSLHQCYWNHKRACHSCCICLADRDGHVLVNWRWLVHCLFSGSFTRKCSRSLTSFLQVRESMACKYLSNSNLMVLYTSSYCSWGETSKTCSVSWHSPGAWRTKHKSSKDIS